MDEIILFVLICAVIVAVVAWFTFNDMTTAELKARKDDEDFERRRAYRQAEFDRHQKAVIRRCLIDTCENIYIGRNK